MILYATSAEEQEHFPEGKEYVSDAGQDDVAVARAATPASQATSAPEADVQDLTLQPDPEVRQVVRI